MKFLGSLVVLISTSLMLQSPLLQAGETADPAGQVTKSEVAGVYNYSVTGDGFGFGGATEPSAMALLQEQGFATVINLRLDSEEGANVEQGRAAAEAAGLDYVHLPFDSKNPAPGYFDEFLAAVQDEAKQPVYIHCGSATRAAALWMSKRVLADDWSMEAAAEEARAIAGKPDAAVDFATGYIETLEQ
jgi:uncharacterized protein (TIGR01244 family)